MPRLSGFIDTLQGPAKEDPKARERFLGIMHAQATRMARLIDDLLSLSRVELSAHVRPDTLVDLVPIILQVVDGLEPLARERQVAIEIELPETPVTIAGDREELLRLFENLIENALKYGASGGKVIVSLAMWRLPSRARPTPRRNTGSWCAISVPASRRSICRGSPSGSTGSTSATAARRAAPGSGCRWSSTFLPAIAAGC